MIDMKKLLYFMSLALVMLFAGCSEGTDFDIDYTPIAPIGGQYQVKIVCGYDATKTDAEYWASNPTDLTVIKNYSDKYYVFLSNTSDYDSDKAWIRVGLYSSNHSATVNGVSVRYCINSKININMSDYTFSGTNVENLAGNVASSSVTATVDGYCGHNTYTTASGTVTDEITLTYSRSDCPGYHFKAHGFKYTGWSDDNVDE